MVTFDQNVLKSKPKAHLLALVVISLLGSILLACNSNSGNDEEAAPTTPLPEESGTATTASSTTSPTDAAVPPPPLVSPLAANDVASLLNLPSAASSAPQLDVTVSGATLVAYQYALVQDSISCLGLSYSSLKEITQKIVDPLGNDGIKTLCVVALSKVGDSDPKASALSYSWIKDSTAPTIIFPALAGYGPASQAGSNFDLLFTASDEASSLGTAQFSLSNGSSCLNALASAFDAACPTLLPATTVSAGAYRIRIADSLLVHGGAYVASAWVSDSVGNTQAAPSTLSFSWDATGPSNAASLTASVSEHVDGSAGVPPVDGVVRRLWGGEA